MAKSKIVLLLALTVFCSKHLYSQVSKKIESKYIIASASSFDIWKNSNNVVVKDKPRNAIDGKIETWWSPNDENENHADKNKGIGEWIQFDFDRNFIIDKIRLVNGFSRNGKKNYLYNNRISRIRIGYSNGQESFFDLKDDHNLQEIDLAEVQTKFIKIWVEEKRLGNNRSAAKTAFWIPKIEFYALTKYSIALIEGIKSNNPKNVRKALKKLQKSNTNPREISIQNCSPFEFVLRSGNEEMALAFIENGFTTNFGKLKHTSSALEVLTYVRDIKNSRQEYERTINRLQQTTFEPTWSLLADLEKKRDTEFDVLFQEEKALLQELLEKHKPRAAIAEIYTLLKKEETSLRDYQDLTILEKFTTRHSNIYSYLEPSKKKELTKALHKRTEVFLQNLMAKEKVKLDMLTGIQGIPLVDQHYSDFKLNYQKYLSWEPCIKAQRFFLDKKTQLVSDNAYQIAKMAEKVNSVKELDALSEKYLSGIYSTHATDTLNQLITSRKELIQKLLREEEEEQRKKELERKNLIKESKELIVNKRKELEIKYESDLPTIEDIHNIMRLGSAIKNQATESDRQKFINKAKSFGYMMVFNKLFSDINLFRNSKGWELVTYRFVDEYNNQIGASATFKVVNAPQEIIELYVMELTTEYRPNSSSYIKPWDGGKIKSESGAYVKSGMTLYHLNLKGDTLQVTASDNLNATRLVVAEKIGNKQLKITPWTNSTNIYLKKGDQITLRATGSITLGVFSVACYPKGISGFRTFNVDERFNHGCLIGKIGDGKWFYVGAQKTITADREGFLQLRINDNIESDNDGHFEVSYSFD